MSANERAFDIGLDYSIESLTDVERILTKWRKRKNRDAIAFGFGCYVGEVLVKHGNGKWVYAEEHRDMMGTPWLVQLPNRLTVNPIGRCYKFMVNGDGVALWAKVTLAISRGGDLLDWIEAESERVGGE